MTREEIINDYNVSDNGIIQSPGKFEGEMLYVPYFFDVFLNGFADDDDGDTISFDVDDNDRALFPELADTTRVSLYVRDDGFVCQQ